MRNQSENIGQAIVNAMNGIERANQNKIAGLFSSFDDADWTNKAKISDDRLKNLIEHMSSFRLRNSDYDYYDAREPPVRFGRSHSSGL